MNVTGTAFEVSASVDMASKPPAQLIVSAAPPPSAVVAGELHSSSDSLFYAFASRLAADEQTPSRGGSLHALTLRKRH